VNRADEPDTTLTGRVNVIMPDPALVVNTGLAYFMPFMREKAATIAVSAE
jgi:hypothetical protein